MANREKTDFEFPKTGYYFVHFIQKEKIEIAALTIPTSVAPEMADVLVDCGIKAIWNFAHVDLDVPEGVQVENVHLSDSLMKLTYNIIRYEEENSISQ